MRKLSPGSAFRSKSHQKIENILYGMNINFDSEIPFHPWRVDIYIPEWHVAIEVDGPQHSPSKDETRDQGLMISYQLPVLHIRTKLGLHKQQIIDMITAYFEHWAETAEYRKHASRQPTT